MRLMILNLIFVFLINFVYQVIGAHATQIVVLVRCHVTSCVMSCHVKEVIKTAKSDHVASSHV